MVSLLDDLNWKLQEAQNYYSMGNYERSADELSDLLEKINEEQPISEKILKIKIEAAFILGKSLNISSKPDKAKQTYDDIKKFTAETSYENYGTALSILGNAQLISKINTDKSIELLEEALRLFQLEEQPSMACIATTYNTFNICYFLKGEIFFRQSDESYVDIVERIIPNLLVEDDCESIGGEKEMVYPHLKPEVLIRIKSIVVKEFGGIDHLPNEISDLMNY